MPSSSLGAAHLVLIALLVASSLARPDSSKRRIFLGLGTLLVLFLPAKWVGPLWSDWETPSRFALDFYLQFFLSLMIPFGTSAAGLFLMGRKKPSAGRPALMSVVIGLYLGGLLASYPISFNYALLYPLLR